MAQLTHGNINRQLISLSAPLLAGNILQQLYNRSWAVLWGTPPSERWGWRAR